MNGKYKQKSFATHVFNDRMKAVNLKRQAKKVLAYLDDDEHYRAMDEEQFQNHADWIREQVQTILWCSIRVAMKEEGLTNRKANTIMCLADKYSGMDMTMDEFKAWCIEKTGMDINA